MVSPIVEVLPALVSPFLKAVIGAIDNSRYKSAKAEAISALELALLWETIGKGNAEKALELARENSDLARTNSELVRENSDLRGTIDTLQNLINKMRQDIAAMQKEANNEEYHY